MYTEYVEEIEKDAKQFDFLEIEKWKGEEHNVPGEGAVFHFGAD